MSQTETPVLPVGADTMSRQVRTTGRPSEVRKIGTKTISRRLGSCTVTGAPTYDFIEIPLAPPREQRDKDGHPIPSVLPESLHPRLFRGTLSAAERFHGVLASMHMGVIIPRDPDPVRDELEKLRSMGLSSTASIVAQALGYKDGRKPLTPGYMFDPGFGDDVLVSSLSAKTLELTADEATVLLDRHARGDHGENGSSVGVQPNADQEFCPFLFDPAVQNAVAIKAGNGLVKSRYNLHRPGIDSPQPSSSDRVEPRRRRNKDEVALVVTLLIPGQAPRSAFFSTLDGNPDL
jgi:hypothetical protein